MHCLGWITLCCAAVSLASAGFCTDRYVCGSTCSGWWPRRCQPKFCTRQVCCPGFSGASCSVAIPLCENSGCSQLCDEVIGSYVCRCLSGYTLASDKKTCTHTGHLCTYTRTCLKTCTRQTCVKKWWRTRCSNSTYQCQGYCTARRCCTGWTGSSCNMPVVK